MNASLDFAPVIAGAPALLKGVGMTLAVSLGSIAVGAPIGMGVCLCRLSRHALLRNLARVYISALRGIPILVLLLLVFYLLPSLGLNVPPVLAAIAALSLNTGAFQAEIYRGGFASIPGGQVEAARALGLPELRILRRILIPQVVPNVLPSLINELIMLLKNSSLTSTITVIELMRASQQIVATSYRPTEVYLAAALLFILMNFGISALGAALGRRMNAHRMARP